MDGPIAAQDSEGCAYGRRPGTHDRELTEVGPGTPCGELMRRYWHPIAVSVDLTTKPQKVRLLGEDLILFRDGRGQPGLLTPNCAHRGASLYYGKVEEDGIRCCYHGWQFDVQGRCIDQPCEPEGGRNKHRVRQPWYPVEERYGLVFAYMGPPEKKPILPRWDMLEGLGLDEKIYAYGYTGFGVGADDTVRIIPWNWMQNWENMMDPFHVPMLHTRHRAVQYMPEAGALPEVDFEPTELGMSYIAHRTLKDGRKVDRVTLAIIPDVALVPDQRLEVTGPTGFLRWLVPVDDESHCLFYALRVPADVDGNELFQKVSRPRPMGDNRMWSEMTEEEHQHYPTDWEAQMSQGTIPRHSAEHLLTTDKGIALLRQLLRRQIRLVQKGEDPIGVTFDPAKAVNKVKSGNYFRPAEPSSTSDNR
jgi:phenylpropionate dioxygenase-like ring-hydroxylating dioxygenase large terminal subunit